MIAFNPSVLSVVLRSLLTNYLRNSIAVWCYTCVMRRANLYGLVIILSVASIASAAPAVDLELATERGVQITAPREWLQLLAGIGIQNVRIRGKQAGDEVRVERQGSGKGASYHLVGVLTARDQLQLPGGTFGRGDTAKLKDYFDRLTADGAEALTAPKGRFGLTDKELEAVFTELTQPIDFETKGQKPQVILDRLQAKLAFKFVIDTDAGLTMAGAKPFEDELKGVSAGTGVVMMLRRDGLLLRPEKPRGRAVVYRISRADEEAITRSTLAKLDDLKLNEWPVGWETEETPGELAPSLFEQLNVEIDGYTAAESLEAIGSRLKVPIFLDHAAVKARHIDLTTVKVKVPKSQTYYKRVLDRVVSQARLGSQLRVDEAGRPFLWVTR